jgi:hypothetical protein
MVDQIAENEKPKDQDPRSLNRQLRDFYTRAFQMNPSVMNSTNDSRSFDELTGKDRIGFIEKSLDMFEKRLKSEANRMLIEKFKILLEPANITPSMKRYAMEDFSAAMVWGSRALPGWMNNDDMGIYNPDKEKVKLIERAEYKTYMKEAILFKRYQDEQPRGETASVQDGLLPEWTAEFKERYGEEI